MRKLEIMLLLIQKILLESNLKMIIELYRHGARREYVNINPIENYPNKNTGKGDITTNGIKSQYLLGKSIYENYPNFFNKEIISSEFEILSSGKNRTLTSAFSQMMGFYNFEKSEEQKIENDNREFYNPPFKNYEKKIKSEITLPKNLKIFPIRTFSKKNDIFFLVEENCPNFKKKQEIKMKKLFSENSDNFLFSYKILQKFLPSKKWVKKDNYDLESAFNICDYIITNIYNDPNFPFPKDILEHCNYIYFYTIFLYSNIGDMRKTYLHLLSSYILEKFKNKIISEKKIKKNFNENLKNNLKGVFISASDGNIGCLLMALNPNNLKCILNNYQEKFLGKKKKK